MSTFLSIAVHSSIHMKKEAYYLLYKNHELKYIPTRNPLESDNLIIKSESGDLESLYKIQTEFLTAFAFANCARLIPSPGITTQISCTIQKCNVRFTERRKIPIDEIMEDFVRISKIDTDIKAQLARLFRVADSQNDVYFSVLFFWHSLVYPERNDDAAVEYINNFLTRFPNYRRGYLANEVREIRKDPIFQPRQGADNLGQYIKVGIRDSIAHIIRNREDTLSITIDSYSEIRHLSHIKTILKEIARHRLYEDFCLNEMADAEICCYIQ